MGIWELICFIGYVWSATNSTHSNVITDFDGKKYTIVKGEGAKNPNHPLRDWFGIWLGGYVAVVLALFIFLYLVP